VTIANKSAVIAGLLDQESKQREKIASNESQLVSMLNAQAALDKNLQQTKDSISDQQTVVEKNKLAISTLKSDIANLETAKINKQKEVDELEVTRAEFVLAKMVLQKDKEELANRELYIMNKYEQAGVSYKDRVTKDSDGTVAVAADLEQRAADLDKREAYIKKQYEKAGVDYL
jgi:chromosome segregation ATPase